jgi:hypothetical protein
VESKKLKSRQRACNAKSQPNQILKVRANDTHIRDILRKETKVGIGEKHGIEQARIRFGEWGRVTMDHGWREWVNPGAGRADGSRAGGATLTKPDSGCPGEIFLGGEEGHGRERDGVNVVGEGNGR